MPNDHEIKEIINSVQAMADALKKDNERIDGKIPEVRMQIQLNSMITLLILQRETMKMLLDATGENNINNPNPFAILLKNLYEVIDTPINNLQQIDDYLDEALKKKFERSNQNAN